MCLTIRNYFSAAFSRKLLAFILKENQTRMFRRPIPRTARVLALSAFLLSSAFARVAPAQTPAAGTFNYVADKISLRPDGVRLDGNARITSPQLEVRAAAIAFDFKNNQI